MQQLILRETLRSTWREKKKVKRLDRMWIKLLRLKWIHREPARERVTPHTHTWNDWINRIIFTSFPIFDWNKKSSVVSSQGIGKYCGPKNTESNLLELAHDACTVLVVVVNIQRLNCVYVAACRTQFTFNHRINSNFDWKLWYVRDGNFLRDWKVNSSSDNRNHWMMMMMMKIHYHVVAILHT